MELADHLGVDGRRAFDRCGYLFVADREETLAQLAANVSVQQQAGVPSTLLTGDELGGSSPASGCRRRGRRARTAPRTATSTARGRWSPHSPTQRRGAARRFERSQVISIGRDGAGWRLETQDGRRARRGASRGCRRVGRRRALVAPLGVALPIVREPRFLLLGEPRAERAARSARDRRRPRRRREAARRRTAARERPARGRGPEDRSRTAGATTSATGLERLLPALAEEPLPTRRRGRLRHDAGRPADRRRGRRRALGRSRLQRPRLHGRAEHRAGSSRRGSAATPCRLARGGPRSTAFATRRRDTQVI